MTDLLPLGRKSLGNSRALPPPLKLGLMSSFRGGLDREKSLGSDRQPNLSKIPAGLVNNQLAVDEELEGKNVVQQRLHIRGPSLTRKQSQRVNEEIASQSLESAGIAHRVCERYLWLGTHIVINGE